MVLRTGKHGKFYGCKGFPLCFNTLNERDAQLQTEAEDNGGESGYDDPSRDEEPLE